MKWIGSSITDLIRRHVESTVERNAAAGRTIRVVLQSLPASVVRTVCSSLADFLANPETQIDCHFKITHQLGLQWATSPDPSVRQDFEFIKSKDWWDAQDHITHFRNIVSVSPDRLVLILLVGVDQVTDQAGLEDFYLVDRTVIWRQQMNASFESWLKPWLSDNHIAYEEDDLEQIDLFLQTLQSCQLMDLVRVSFFLESLNLTAAQDGRDVLHAMGRNLFSVGLPLLRNLPQITKRKALEGYINDAITFFGYHDYIDEAKRKKGTHTRMLLPDARSAAVIAAPAYRQLDLADQAISVREQSKIRVHGVTWRSDRLISLKSRSSTSLYLIQRQLGSIRAERQYFLFAHMVPLELCPRTFEVLVEPLAEGCGGRALGRQLLSRLQLVDRRQAQNGHRHTELGHLL